MYSQNYICKNEFVRNILRNILRSRSESVIETNLEQICTCLSDSSDVGLELPILEELIERVNGILGSCSNKTLKKKCLIIIKLIMQKDCPGSWKSRMLRYLSVNLERLIASSETHIANQTLDCVMDHAIHTNNVGHFLRLLLKHVTRRASKDESYFRQSWKNLTSILEEDTSAYVEVNDLEEVVVCTISCASNTDSELIRAYCARVIQFINRLPSRVVLDSILSNLSQHMRLTFQSLSGNGAASANEVGSNEAVRHFQQKANNYLEIYKSKRHLQPSRSTLHRQSMKRVSILFSKETDTMDHNSVESSGTSIDRPIGQVAQLHQLGDGSVKLSMDRLEHWLKMLPAGKYGISDTYTTDDLPLFEKLCVLLNDDNEEVANRVTAGLQIFLDNLPLKFLQQHAAKMIKKFIESCDVHIASRGDNVRKLIIQLFRKLPSEAKCDYSISIVRQLEQPDKLAFLLGILFQPTVDVLGLADTEPVPSGAGEQLQASTSQIVQSEGNFLPPIPSKQKNSHPEDCNEIATEKQDKPSVSKMNLTESQTTLPELVESGNISITHLTSKIDSQRRLEPMPSVTEPQRSQLSLTHGNLRQSELESHDQPEQTDYDPLRKTSFKDQVMSRKMESAQLPHLFSVEKSATSLSGITSGEMHRISAIPGAEGSVEITTSNRMSHSTTNQYLRKIKQARVLKLSNMGMEKDNREIRTCTSPVPSQLRRHQSCYLITNISEDEKQKTLNLPEIAVTHSSGQYARKQRRTIKSALRPVKNESKSICFNSAPSITVNASTECVISDELILLRTHVLEHSADFIEDPVVIAETANNLEQDLLSTDWTKQLDALKYFRQLLRSAQYAILAYLIQQPESLRAITMALTHAVRSLRSMIARNSIHLLHLLGYYLILTEKGHLWNKLGHVILDSLLARAGGDSATRFLQRDAVNCLQVVVLCINPSKVTNLLCDPILSGRKLSVSGRKSLGLLLLTVFNEIEVMLTDESQIERLFGRSTMEKLSKAVICLYEDASTCVRSYGRELMQKILNMPQGELYLAQHLSETQLDTMKEMHLVG